MIVRVRFTARDRVCQVVTLREGRWYVEYTGSPRKCNVVARGMRA